MHIRLHSLIHTHSYTTNFISATFHCIQIFEQKCRHHESIILISGTHILHIYTNQLTQCPHSCYQLYMSYTSYMCLHQNAQIHIKGICSIYVQYTRISHDNILSAWHCICRFCIRIKMNDSIHTLTDACVKLVFVQALRVGNSVFVHTVLFTWCTGSACNHTFKQLFLFTYQCLHNKFKHPFWLVSTAILLLSLYSLYSDTSSLMYPVLISIATVSLTYQILISVFRHPFTVFRSSHNSTWLYVITLKQSVFLFPIK